MIVEFRVTNFKSFKEQTSLSFVACDCETFPKPYSTIILDDGTSLKLLNSMVILGANGSGKSNLLYALKGLHFMITQSRKFNVRYRNPYYLPFALDKLSKFEPVGLKLEFIALGKRYVYTVEYNTLKILKEELEEIILKENRMVFSIKRDNEKSDKGILTIGKDYKNANLDWAYRDLLPNQLLMSKLGTFIANGLQEIYGVLSENSIIDFNGNDAQVAEEILQDMDSETFKQLTRLIRISDVGVDDIQMMRHNSKDFSFPTGIPEIERERFIEQCKWEIQTKHGDYFLELSAESTGIKNLFYLGALILDTINK